MRTESGIMLTHGHGTRVGLWSRLGRKYRVRLVIAQLLCALQKKFPIGFACSCN